MVKCGEECTPICDFCIWALHEVLEDKDGEKIKGEPVYCDLHDEFLNGGAGWCWDYHCFRATPSNHVYISKPPEEAESDAPDESTRIRAGIRGRAYRRKMNWTKARRKRRICRKAYGWEYYSDLNRYSKGKIHCSCPMCSAKTRPKKFYGGQSDENWSIKDQKKRDSMVDQELNLAR